MQLLVTNSDQALEALYNRVTGDEDARVCRDIPGAACHDQPHNFFAHMANIENRAAYVAAEPSQSAIRPIRPPTSISIPTTELDTAT